MVRSRFERADIVDHRRIHLVWAVAMMTWLFNNWLAVLVVGFGIVSLIIAFGVYAAMWIAGRDDELLDRTKTKNVSGVEKRTRI